MAVLRSPVDRERGMYSPIAPVRSQKNADVSGTSVDAMLQFCHSSPCRGGGFCCPVKGDFPQGPGMIKSELVARLTARYPHLYHRDIERIVSTMLDEITKALAEGHRVELRGFGAFSVKVRPARQGRN